MKLGYARVSTTDQDLSRQIAALQAAGCERIFQDKVSGAKSSRPELDEMLAVLSPGDTVVVLKLDRLGRSLIHLLELMEDFKKRDVKFISLGDNIDSSTPAGRMMFNIMGSLAEFERELIVERVNHGLAHARSQGRVGGRPRVDPEPIIDLKKRGFSKAEIARRTKVSVRTIDKILAT